MTVEQSALGGPTAIGTFKHLPPVLTAKYNFIPDGIFRPYVGVGINLTIISDVHVNVPTPSELTSWTRPVWTPERSWQRAVGKPTR